MNHPPPPPRPPTEDALIGTVLADRYKVLERIGEGGMGSVYVGEHVTLGKKVALKVLKAELANDKTVVQRFLREAKATSSIEHENIVEILDFGHTPSGSAFFVMEFLRGQELTEAIADAVQMPWGRAKGILVQLCFGLAAAHDLGIVHRDMKPGNVILLKKSGRADFVKILDFGIAKIEDAQALTRAGMVFGTAAYMAPEQATASGVDGRSDMYAVACIAFEMMTGRLPFDAKHPVKMLNCHIREPAPSMRFVAAEATIPEAVDNAILKAMSKQPDERFIDMYDFARTLDAIPVDDAPSQHAPPPMLGGYGRAPGPSLGAPPPPLADPLPTVPPPPRDPTPPRPHHAISSGSGPQRASAHAAGAIGERTEPRQIVHHQRPQPPPRRSPRKYDTDPRAGGPPPSARPPRPQARRAPLSANANMGTPPPIPGVRSAYPPELPALAWIFVGLAEAAEDDLGNRHLLEIAKRLWRWAQTLTLEELNALVRHTLADYRALPDVATRGARTREYNTELAKVLSRSRLAEVLTTLYSISSDNGRVRERELRFIVNCTQQLGLSPDPRLLAIAFLYVMMSAADGQIDDQERHALREQAKMWAPKASIAERAVVLRWATAEFKRRPTHAEQLQTAREAADQLAATTDQETLRRILNGLWRIAGADGHIAPEEKAFINEMVQRFRLH